ncbi:hypothetical protein LEQ41_00010 [Streptococcus agalactiae]|nr:hypothetical protein [Streptococcus agalactiae]
MNKYYNFSIHKENNLFTTCGKVSCFSDTYPQSLPDFIFDSFYLNS